MGRKRRRKRKEKEEEELKLTFSTASARRNVARSTRSVQRFFFFSAAARETISVITNDGRNIVGVLKGFDQATNIILDESHERVFSTKEGVQQLVLGLYIIRGDNISIVGELDADLDSTVDWSNMRAYPSSLSSTDSA
ncbi:Small nuclear ribonucleoprotein family protein [Prunus dulcis]|uniref:U6 snRNA-associated Sm-like protein LSm8 n=1 Tax=Prunus dulcis TaxID=3755 RepID=A0A4Y1QW86_PRUDU|nr:Small nuclear ribonucleoprotein family protein [Prunus dulcis]